MELLNLTQTSIKEQFGGEVPFTKYISTNKDIADSLLSEIELSVGDYSIQAEEHTTDSKRVDCVIRDEEKEIVSVVEAMSIDRRGLDSIHVSKTSYYCYDKDCYDAVIICEDSSEHIKGYVRWFNEETPLNVHLVQVKIYKDKEEKIFILFNVLIRPNDINQKKIINKNGPTKTRPDFTDFLKQKFDECNNTVKGTFTHQTGRYVSTNNVAGLGCNVGITPRKNGTFHIDYYHNEKYKDNETFNQSLKQLDSSFKIKRNNAYVTTDNWDDAFSTHQKMVKALQNKEVIVS